MSADLPRWSRPAEFKTQVDGKAGLVRIVLVGAPHDGHELFMDEMDLPDEIYASGRADAFEWWPTAVQEHMARTPTGGDPQAPAVRYVLEIPSDTLEPRLVAKPDGR